jgi:chromosome segregation ATPase
VPGSIVRVQLKNFVTYDFVEFRPGPYLNMILGPNGTGKSSIACALCLGLNFPPAVLGRAAEVSSFVKDQQGSGHIEIELKSPAGEENIIIRRELVANSKTTKFTINKKSASGAQVTERIAALNIQVGNLWYAPPLSCTTASNIDGTPARSCRRTRSLSSRG